MSRKFVALVLLGMALLIGFYLHGSFDRPLSSIGLNFHECDRNGFGATFCGSELDRYRERATQGQHKGTEATAAYERCRAEDQVIEANNQRTEAHNREVNESGRGRVELLEVLKLCVP